MFLRADDTQIYISVSVSDVHAAMQRFSACVYDINDWMRASYCG